MTRNQVIVLGMIGFLAIAFVRMLEQPDAPPDEPLGMLFRTDSLDTDPMALAACAALLDPVRELFGGPEAVARVEPDPNHAGGCMLEVEAPLRADAASPEARLRTVFDMMGWTPAQGPGGAGRSYRREPVSCTRAIERGADRVSISIRCRLDEAAGSESR